MSRSEHNGCRRPKCGVCRPWKRRGTGKIQRAKASDQRRLIASADQ